MNQFYPSRLSMPIITGTPPVKPSSSQAGKPASGQQGSEISFQAQLQQMLARQSSVEFSGHAISRVAQRSIDVSDANLQRLSEGVRIAQERGLGDTLILIDRTAFLVNAKSNKVITTVDGEDLKGNLFTNIDGAVII